MALLPQGPFALVALVGIVAGLAYVLRRGVPKAYGLGLLMMGVFLLDVVSVLAGQGHLQEALGFRAADFFAGDGWWTPLTSVFVHAAPESSRGGGFFSLHFGANLLLLVTAGPALEERLGERRFLLLFFGAALAALVAHVALAYLTDITSPQALALGASGGLFGVLTAFAVRYPRERLPMLLIFFFFQMPAFAVLLLYLAINLVYLLSDAMGVQGNVAWWGHFAGFLVGLAYAYRLPRRDPRFMDVAAGPGGLPDPEKLAPLATTPALNGILDKVRQFRPDARTKDDAQFALAWVDRFLAKASCPTCGTRFHRKGLSATCERGETTVDFARAP